MNPIVIELRVNPVTYALIRDRLLVKLDAADQVAVSAIRIVTDPTVARGWLHEHDAAGTLIRRIPPVGDRRRAHN